MRKSIVSILLLTLTMVDSASLPALLRRYRRSLSLIPTTYPTPTATPTTYAVPTTHVQTIGIVHQLEPSAAGVSVPCPVKRDVSVRRLTADDELMKTIFLGLGGQWDDRYMASSLEEADKTFINLLAEPTKLQGPIGHVAPVTKKKVKDDLKKLESWRLRMSAASGANRKLRKVLSRKPGGSGDTEFRLEKLAALNNKTVADLQRELGIEGDLQYLQQLHSYTRQRTRRSSAIPPSGSFTSVDFCVNRGALTLDGYMHLCTNCAVTLSLTSDRFPRVLNEVMCDSNDCNCITVRGHSHGKCRQRQLTMTMMRRKPNLCRLLHQNGHPVVTDDWELYSQPINVGCECVIDKRSVFAPYVPKP